MRRETPSIWRVSSLNRCVPLDSRASTTTLHLAARTLTACWSAATVCSSSGACDGGIEWADMVVEDDMSVAPDLCLRTRFVAP
jgi:hypothetical protein